MDAVSQNPYSIMFGIEPAQNIQRKELANQVKENFGRPDPSIPLYMITGVRGSGKTVFLTELADYFGKQKDWIVVNITSDGDILRKVAEALTAQAGIAQIFQNADINLSFFGFGLKVSPGSPKITSMEIALDKMLQALKEKRKRVLVTIDEVMKTKEMISFVSACQLYLREKLPLFLLMTGLHENIQELQNVKNLTFLYRAPHLFLEPLGLGDVKQNYQETFGFSQDTALAMAQKTRGYPYAFQLLGYYTWENDRHFSEDVCERLKEQLYDYSYQITWRSLSEKDRWFLHGIAQSPSKKVSDIMSGLAVTNREFSPYRKRLIQKGLVHGNMRGYVKFTLPFFEEFVMTEFDNSLDYE